MFTRPRFICALVVVMLLSGCSLNHQDGGGTVDPWGMRFTVHQECALEMERALSSKETDGGFSSIPLTSSCAGDFLFALNQGLGGGQ